MLPCDFSFTTILFPIVALFSDLNISQGSIATRLGYGRIFKFTAEYASERKVKSG